MSADISMSDLVNLSIGTPEVGAVNFNALHTLLHALLGHLQIKHITTNWREEDAPPQERHTMEDKLRQIERQIASLEKLPSGTELLSRTAPGTTPVNDMWQLMQLRRKAQANEDGVSKFMALIQDLLKEIQDLKESRDGLKKEVKSLKNQLDQLDVGVLADRITVVEECCHRVDDLETATRELQNTVALYPHPDEMNQCVTWDIMQSALVSERQKLQKELRDSVPVSVPTAVGEPATPLHSATPYIASSNADTVPASPFAATAPGSVAPGSVAPGSVAPAPATPTQSRTTQSRTALPHLSTSDEALGGGRSVTRVASGAERYPEAVEALRDVGTLRERHETLEARVELLEERKADQAQLQNLRKLIADLGDKDVPGNLLDQLTHLRTLVDSLMSDREKVGELEQLIMSVGTETRTGKDTAGGSHSEEASESDTEDQGNLSPDSSQNRQFKMQIAYLRNAVQKLETEVQLLKKGDTSAKAEQKSKKDTHLQDQLDNLRGMLEDMMASSSSMLSRSLQQEPQGPEEQGQGQGQDSDDTGGQEGTCPSCSVDVSRKVSQLFQCYEKLQGLVTSVVTKQQRGGGGGGGKTGESTELMSDVQQAILQLQAECEKLHSTADHLMEEHSQKEVHIDNLYKSLEELEAKKADKELLEMEIEIKADKRALETKVSRMQFDTMTEQLNTMFQELLSKITDQEQGWHKVIEKISTEMECKLNRIELDPLKKQLEDRWNNMRKQLQAQPAPDQDDAAGIRKQLLARFHCISCDRPVDMLTPRPPRKVAARALSQRSHLVTVPSTPGMPRPYTVPSNPMSNRPYTVCSAGEPAPAHRGLMPGTNHSHFALAHSDRNMAQVRRIHTMMCRQIERVQCHLGFPERPNRKGALKEISTYLPILAPLQRTSQSVPKVERIPEMADYRFLAMSRNCGGSHTLTFPNRRCSRLQHISQFNQAEEETQAPVSCTTLRIQPEEVDIRGLDGHIYKGRRNTKGVKTVDAKLPDISPKDGMCKSKDKVMRSQSQKSGSTDPCRGTPVRPQSAKTQWSRSASSSSVRDRTMSSLGCLSQGTLLPQSSSHTDTTSELQPGLELHMDLSQSEEEPVTTL